MLKCTWMNIISSFISELLYLQKSPIYEVRPWVKISDVTWNRKIEMCVAGSPTTFFMLDLSSPVENKTFVVNPILYVYPILCYIATKNKILCVRIRSDGSSDTRLTWRSIWTRYVQTEFPPDTPALHLLAIMDGTWNLTASVISLHSVFVIRNTL